MTRLPSLKVRQVIGGLQKLGFEEVRQKGSHAIFAHQDSRRVPIPVHQDRDISPYFLADILKELRIDEDEFMRAVHH